MKTANDNHLNKGQAARAAGIDWIRWMVFGITVVLVLDPVTTAAAERSSTDLPNEVISREYPEDYPELRDVQGEDRPRYYVPSTDTSADGYGVPVHDEFQFVSLASDRLEYRRVSDDEDVILWDLQMSMGTDFRKLHLESEGEWEDGGSDPETATVELLYGQALTAFWNLRFGLRQDLEPTPERTFAVIGLAGLAPQWVETDLTLNLGEEGDVRSDLEAEYNLYLSQRLILQPRLETEVLLEEQPEYGLGNGVTGAEFGLRLRYEIWRKFAPYVGVSHESALDETADIAERSGEDPDKTVIVSGLKFWF
jgi:copper resistance protein B